MQQKISSNFKLGIIGGGQLGKMLVQAASKWDIKTYILDPDENCSAASLCTKFIKGSFRTYEDVYQFAQQVDLVTFEIEHVNIEALKRLKEEGKTIHPDPNALTIIQDKGLQKQFYASHNLPTAKFQLYQSKAEIIAAIEEKKITLPFVQKSRKEGYDGRGVIVINSEKEIEKIFDTPSIVEETIAIEKELAVIVAKNTKNEISSFSVVEMGFNSEANLLEDLICPAAISKQIEEEAIALSKKVIKKLDMVGILAVELFLTKAEKLLINEVAPRPHNSGHHTIESAFTSQFEQHLRAILGFPLGSTKIIMPAIMLNLLGEPNYTGDAIYKGFEESIAIEGVYVHIYGKTSTKPYRKMGHVTIIEETIEKAKVKAEIIKTQLKIIA